MTTIKTTKRIYQKRIDSKDAFGFAEPQEKATNGVWCKLGLQGDINILVPNHKVNVTLKTLFYQEEITWKMLFGMSCSILKTNHNKILS